MRLICNLRLHLGIHTMGERTIVSSRLLCICCGTLGRSLLCARCSGLLQVQLLAAAPVETNESRDCPRSQSDGCGGDHPDEGLEFGHEADKNKRAGVGGHGIGEPTATSTGREVALVEPRIEELLYKASAHNLRDEVVEPCAVNQQAVHCNACPIMRQLKIDWVLNGHTPSGGTDKPNDEVEETHTACTHEQLPMHLLRLLHHRHQLCVDENRSEDPQEIAECRKHV
mmetsp:Transcript_69661/g.199652  ORF Transcript_69661/g.199652 Transcript_69661/m.199652 type:complete len:227 (-) Transcript_69661:698-1378(-)